MPAGINGLENANQYPHESVDTAAGQQREVVGQNAGQQVVYQPSTASLIQDAQEEVTEMFCEKSSDKLKHHEARTKSQSRLREILRKYLEHIPGNAQAEKFNQTIESLKKMEKPTSGQIRDLLKRQRQEGHESEFESGMLLALEEALVSEGADAKLIAAVREAKAELGVELQDFYNSQVKTYESIDNVYDQLLGEYGEDDFQAGTELMIKRLGDSMLATNSATDHAKLKSTVDSLFQLELARNTFKQFSALASKLSAEFGLKLQHA